MRKLLYIPIVHNQADLGSLSLELMNEGEKKYGVSEWSKHIEEVQKSWDRVEIEINKKLENISPNKIRIYQDGLPDNGDIGMKIVDEVSRNGSKNYQIISNLIKSGAILEVAENKDLLFQEYNLITDIIKSETQDEKLKAYLLYQEMSEKLLNDRDAFISNKINTSLNVDEIGIAFFGVGHSIVDKINDDILIVKIEMFDDEISLNLKN